MFNVFLFQGTEGCLAELTFVITGVLDSLELDQTEELVRKYGRKATHSVSGKTNFIVVGEGTQPNWKMYLLLISKIKLSL